MEKAGQSFLSSGLPCSNSRKQLTADGRGFTRIRLAKKESLSNAANTFADLRYPCSSAASIPAQEERRVVVARARLVRVRLARRVGDPGRGLVRPVP